MQITQLGRHGRITLPPEILRFLQAKEGGRIVFLMDGERVIIRRLTQSLLDVRGSVPVAGQQDFDDVRRQVAGQRARRGSEK